MTPISYAEKMKPPKPTKAQKDAELKPQGWEEEPTQIEIKQEQIKVLQEEIKDLKTGTNETPFIEPVSAHGAPARPSTAATIPAKKLSASQQKAELVEGAELGENGVLPSDLPEDGSDPVILSRRSRPKSF